MYGRCQADDRCTDDATHVVRFTGQPDDPMYVCPEHADEYRREGHEVRKL